MEQRLTIITLGVADLQAAAEFYRDHLGWKQLDSSSESIVFFQLNGILLSLYPKGKLAEDAGVPEQGNGFKGFSMAHNVRSEEEVDMLMGALAHQGVRIVKPQQKTGWGGYSGYIADLDGNLWEIAYNPFLTLDAQGNVKEA